MTSWWSPASSSRLFGSRKQGASGAHEFDRLCAALGIEHRLTQTRNLKTHGMAERFNGRMAEVLATHRFNSKEDLESTLMRYVGLYNHPLPKESARVSHSDRSHEKAVR